MNELEMPTHDLYIKYMDKKGSVTYVCHRVWDAERFLTAREAEAKREGGSIAVADPVQYRLWKEGRK